MTPINNNQIMPKKTCPCCKKELDIDNFYPCKTKQGVRPYCKKCNNEKIKEWKHRKYGEKRKEARKICFDEMMAVKKRLIGIFNNAFEYGEDGEELRDENLGKTHAQLVLDLFDPYLLEKYRFKRSAK